MRSCSALLSRSSARRSASDRPGLRCERVEVRPQAGQRRAQLVAGVGGEAARRGHRGLQPREHPVERAGERADLVGALVGQRRSEVLRARHARGARLQARERAHGERAEEPGGEAGEDEREQADQQDQPPDARHSLVDRLERGERLEARVGGPAEQDRQRAPRAAGDLDRREALAIGWGGRGGRHVAVLRDDVATVGDLHEGARPLQERPPAARAVAAEAAFARRAAQHLGGLLAQLLVDRLAAVARDGREQQRARDRPAERDRQQCPEREPRAQAARRPHGRSAQPTPRTVCSVRGSPPASSLRRT